MVNGGWGGGGGQDVYLLCRHCTGAVAHDYHINAAIRRMPV